MKTQSRVLAQFSDMARAFLAPEISQVDRENRGRQLADAAIDLERGTRISDAVMPAIVAAGVRSDQDLAEVSEMRMTRTMMQQVLDDLPGMVGKSVVSDTWSTGLSDGLPLIREYSIDDPAANPMTQATVPGLVKGPDTGDVDPDLSTVPDVAPWTIANIGDDVDWHWSVIRPEIPLQLAKFASERGLRLLDSLAFDVADRGAEKWIGAALLAAAAAPAESTGSLGDALDAAESEAAAELNSSADMLIAHPSDWPRIRRQVAQAWQVGPAPVRVLSVGITPGTALVTGRRAFTLFRKDYEVMRTTAPRNFKVQMAVARPFYLAIRNAAAIRAVSL